MGGLIGRCYVRNEIRKSRENAVARIRACRAASIDLVAWFAADSRDLGSDCLRTTPSQGHIYLAARRIRRLFAPSSNKSRVKWARKQGRRSSSTRCPWSRRWESGRSCGTTTTTISTTSICESGLGATSPSICSMRSSSDCTRAISSWTVSKRTQAGHFETRLFFKMADLNYL